MPDGCAESDHLYQPITRLKKCMSRMTGTYAGMDGTGEDELIPANWVASADEGQYEDDTPHSCLQVSMLMKEQLLLRACYVSTMSVLLNQALPDH